jgi:hypothetical protein
MFFCRRGHSSSASQGGLLKSFLRDQLLPPLALLFRLAFLVAMSPLVNVVLYAASPAVAGLFARLASRGRAPDVFRRARS